MMQEPAGINGTAALMIQNGRPRWFHRPIELFRRNVQDRCVRLLAPGIARDQDIQTPERRHRACDQVNTERFLTKIAGNGHSPSAARIDDFDDIVGIRLFLGQMVDRHIRTLAGESDGRCPTHAGISACDQRPASREPARTAIGHLAVIQYRLHVDDQPRPWLLLLGKRRPRVLGNWILQNSRQQSRRLGGRAKFSCVTIHGTRRRLCEGLRGISFTKRLFMKSSPHTAELQRFRNIQVSHDFFMFFSDPAHDKPPPCCQSAIRQD